MGRKNGVCLGRCICSRNDGGKRGGRENVEIDYKKKKIFFSPLWSFLTIFGG